MKISTRRSPNVVVSTRSRGSSERAVHRRAKTSARTASVTSRGRRSQGRWTGRRGRRWSRRRRALSSRSRTSSHPNSPARRSNTPCNTQTSHLPPYLPRPFLLRRLYSSRGRPLPGRSTSLSPSEQLGVRSQTHESHS